MHFNTKRKTPTYLLGGGESVCGHDRRGACHHDSVRVVGGQMPPVTPYSALQDYHPGNILEIIVRARGNCYTVGQTF